MLQDSSAMAKAIRNPQAEGEPHLSSRPGAACVVCVLRSNAIVSTISDSTVLLSGRGEQVTEPSLSQTFCQMQTVSEMVEDGDCC